MLREGYIDGLGSTGELLRYPLPRGDGMLVRSRFPRTPVGAGLTAAAVVEPGAGHAVGRQAARSADPIIRRARQIAGCGVETRQLYVTGTPAAPART
jgi:hypothetical protein